MHALVRDLYKRALVVGKDYPLGLEYVRRTWKKALRNPENCPSCYFKEPAKNMGASLVASLEAPGCEKEIRKAIGRGRFMIREMIGVIQLKKYRTMKRRYDNKEKDPSISREYTHLLIQHLDDKSKSS